MVEAMVVVATAAGASGRRDGGRRDGDCGLTTRYEVRSDAMAMAEGEGEGEGDGGGKGDGSAVAAWSRRAVQRGGQQHGGRQR